MVANSFSAAQSSSFSLGGNPKSIMRDAQADEAPRLGVRMSTLRTATLLDGRCERAAAHDDFVALFRDARIGHARHRAMILGRVVPTAGPLGDITQHVPQAKRILTLEI